MIFRRILKSQRNSVLEYRRGKCSVRGSSEFCLIIKYSTPIKYSLVSVSIQLSNPDSNSNVKLKHLEHLKVLQFPLEEH